MSEICACCRRRLGSATGESGLYSPNRVFILCEPCFFKEDALIEEVGTNNIPEQIERYRKNLQLGERP